MRTSAKTCVCCGADIVDGERFLSIDIQTVASQGDGYETKSVHTPTTYCHARESCVEFLLEELPPQAFEDN